VRYPIVAVDVDDALVGVRLAVRDADGGRSLEELQRRHGFVVHHEAHLLPVDEGPRHLYQSENTTYQHF
jgi:hypothetical protein